MPHETKQAAGWLPAVALAAILLATAVLYVHVAHRHEPVTDEAVFGRASLEILNGDWFLTSWRVMKPPLVYYAQAAARAILGHGAFAGRVPNVLASLIGMLLLFRIARRWTDPWVGALAAAIVALSPFGLEHLPTGRADALALVFVLGAADLAGASRVRWAGLVFALAFATRQTSALSLPLVLAFAWLASPIADVSAPRRAVRLVWRFFVGTLPVLALLLVWSLFERIPFAWLVNEFQGKKYSEGAHLQIGYFTKLGHWLGGVADFFAGPGLLLAGVVGLVLGWRQFAALTRRREWRARPADAATALLAAFVTLFLLLHGLRFFTVYLRFLVPLLPWAAWLAAVPLVTLARRAFAWKRNAGRAVVAAMVAALLVPAVLVQMSEIHRLSVPWSEDDIPAAIAHLARHPYERPLLYTREYGPETDFATWRTPVASRQIHGKLDRLGDLARRDIDYATYLFLSPADVAAWEARLRAEVAPLFRLEKIDDSAIRTGTLYRLARESVGGVHDENIGVWREGAIADEPFTCATLGDLILDALAGSARRDTANFEWQVCVPSTAPGILAWKAGGFAVGKFVVRDAAFYYTNPQVDWNALALLRRLVVRGASSGRAEFLISTAEIAAHVARQNRNLSDVVVRVELDGLHVTATAAVGPLRVKVEAAGWLGLTGDELSFSLDQAYIGAWSVPAFLAGYAEKVMNPVGRIDLAGWGLVPTAVVMFPAPVDAVVLRATTKNAGAVNHTGASPQISQTNGD